MVARSLFPESFCNLSGLAAGLNSEVLSGGASYAHEILDSIDAMLIERASPRVSELVELANFSSIVGNLLATGIVRSSNGAFKRAGPHKYQDLRATDSASDTENIEIKVALEKNRPKGHLAKEGYYLTCRYVLGDEDGGYDRTQRGDVAWIWELRFGYLEEKHFKVSNTEGDSGKTAPVTKEGMSRLTVVYFDSDRCPYAQVGRYRKENGLLGTETLPLLEDGLGNRSS